MSPLTAFREGSLYYKYIGGAHLTWGVVLGAGGGTVRQGAIMEVNEGQTRHGHVRRGRLDRSREAGRHSKGNF